MGELYEERRQEPRFTVPGRYRLENGRTGNVEGRILDLSLNGALLEHNDGVKLESASHHAVTLEFDGQPPFRGDSLLVWVDTTRIGIEFYDMDPQNFAALSALIEALSRTHR